MTNLPALRGEEQMVVIGQPGGLQSTPPFELASHYLDRARAQRHDAILADLGAVLINAGHACFRNSQRSIHRVVV